MAHKTTVWVIVVLAIVWAFFFFTFEFGREKEQVSGPAPASTPINKTVEFEINDVLPGFPGAQDLPLPPSATLIRNYQSISPDGRVQATKMLTSPKDVQENFDYFKDFLTSNKSGWKVLAEVTDSPTRKSIFAQNSGGFLNVHVYTGDEGETAIEVSFLLTQAQ